MVKNQDLKYPSALETVKRGGGANREPIKPRDILAGLNGRYFNVSEFLQVIEIISV